jgi:hypothetical protein
MLSANENVSNKKKKKKQGIVQFPPGKIGDLKQN